MDEEERKRLEAGFPPNLPSRTATTTKTVTKDGDTTTTSTTRVSDGRAPNAAQIAAAQQAAATDARQSGLAAWDAFRGSWQANRDAQNNALATASRDIYDRAFVLNNAFDNYRRRGKEGGADQMMLEAALAFGATAGNNMGSVVRNGGRLATEVTGSDGRTMRSGWNGETGQFDFYYADKAGNLVKELHMSPKTLTDRLVSRGYMEDPAVVAARGEQAARDAEDRDLANAAKRANIADIMDRIESRHATDTGDGRMDSKEFRSKFLEAAYEKDPEARASALNALRELAVATGVNNYDADSLGKLFDAANKAGGSEDELAAVNVEDILGGGGGATTAPTAPATEGSAPSASAPASSPAASPAAPAAPAPQTQAVPRDWSGQSVTDSDGSFAARLDAARKAAANNRRTGIFRNGKELTDAEVGTYGLGESREEQRAGIARARERLAKQSEEDRTNLDAAFENAEKMTKNGLTMKQSLDFSARVRNGEVTGKEADVYRRIALREIGKDMGLDRSATPDEADRYFRDRTAEETSEDKSRRPSKERLRKVEGLRSAYYAADRIADQSNTRAVEAGVAANDAKISALRKELMDKGVSKDSLDTLSLLVNSLPIGTKPENDERTATASRLIRDEAGYEEDDTVRNGNWSELMDGQSRRDWERFESDDRGESVVREDAVAPAASPAVSQEKEPIAQITEQEPSEARATEEQNIRSVLDENGNYTARSKEYLAQHGLSEDDLPEGFAETWQREGNEAVARLTLKKNIDKMFVTYGVDGDKSPNTARKRKSFDEVSELLGSAKIGRNGKYRVQQKTSPFRSRNTNLVLNAVIGMNRKITRGARASEDAYILSEAELNRAKERIKFLQDQVK